MAGTRMSADEICKVIGDGRGNGKPIAKTTLYRHFSNEMKNGPAGYNKNPKLTAKARKAGQEANARKAAARAADIAPVIKELQAAGATSLYAIADGLNERGIPTARGSGKWSATQVMRVLARGPAGPFVVVSAAA
jgi:hypothetical protein